MTLFADKRRPGLARQPVELPRDEMAFRKRYQHLLLARRITTVFRPGDRLYPAWRGYAPGETVTARVIARRGSDLRGMAPVFNDVRVPIVIDEVWVKPIGALTPGCFEGSSPDVCDVRSLARHLSDIYRAPLSDFGSIVTLIRFRYQDARP